MTGFVNDVGPLYRSSDIVISKPGPMTILEAVRWSVPLLLEVNRATAIQERYHAEWVRARGIGITFGRMSELPELLRRVSKCGWRRRHRQSTRQLRARELPSCSEAILQIIDGATAKSSHSPLAKTCEQP